MTNPLIMTPTEQPWFQSQLPEQLCSKMLIGKAQSWLRQQHGSSQSSVHPAHCHRLSFWPCDSALLTAQQCSFLRRSGLLPCPHPLLPSTAKLQLGSRWLEVLPTKKSKQPVSRVNAKPSGYFMKGISLAAETPVAFCTKPQILLMG